MSDQDTTITFMQVQGYIGEKFITDPVKFAREVDAVIQARVQTALAADRNKRDDGYCITCLANGVYEHSASSAVAEVTASDSRERPASDAPYWSDYADPFPKSWKMANHPEQHLDMVKDAAELRDIAQYFDERGKKSNGDFLRKIADLLSAPPVSAGLSDEEMPTPEYAKAAAKTMQQFMLQERFRARDWHPIGDDLSQDATDLAYSLDLLTEATAIILNFADRALASRVSQRVVELERQNADLMLALQEVRAGIAGDRCDGDTEYALGVNDACGNHLKLVDHMMKRANPLTEACPRLSDEEIRKILVKYSTCIEPGLYSSTEFDCTDDVIAFARAVALASRLRLPEGWTYAMKAAFINALPTYSRNEVDHPGDTGKSKYHMLEDDDVFDQCLAAAIAAAPSEVQAKPSLQGQPREEG